MRGADYKVSAARSFSRSLLLRGLCCWQMLQKSVTSCWARERAGKNGRQLDKKSKRQVRRACVIELKPRPRRRNMSGKQKGRGAEFYARERWRPCASCQHRVAPLTLLIALVAGQRAAPPFTHHSPTRHRSWQTPAASARRGAPGARRGCPCCRPPSNPPTCEAMWQCMCTACSGVISGSAIAGATLSSRAWQPAAAAAASMRACARMAAIHSRVHEGRHVVV